MIYPRESMRVAYKRIATVGSSATTYTDSKLVAGKPYQYAVKAYSRQNSKYVYSKYTAATGATRPYATTVTPTVLSSSQVKLTWKPVARLDGYRIYRRASGGKWTLVADVNKKTTAYIDKKVSAGTKYIYTVRAYKRGGREKYAAAVRPSRSVITPKATNISQIWFTSSQKVVMKNILYAVETGGQVYGNQDYADFTRAYTNSSAEHAITIGAGQWYATEAQRLLKLIHTTMGDAQWKRYDRDNKLWTDVQKANPDMKVILLRYFNPVGAHESGRIGEDPKGIPNNLMPYISQVAVGKLEKLGVFGDDYDTPDGTGVRDYIHVVDLAKGHVKAINYIFSNPGLDVINLGTGVGYSVLDMVKAFGKACGKEIPYEIKPRRAGDIAMCYADPAKAARVLGWKAEKGLDEMCADTWRWQSQNPNGYEK